MKSKKIKKWLLNNCIDKNGDLDLTGLDFSDFEGNIDISGMKVKKYLTQKGHVVERDLFQGDQEVKGTLYQVEIVASPTVNHDFKDPEHWDPTPKDINNHHNCIDIIVEENHDLKTKISELEISLRAYRDWVKELKDKIKEEMNNE